MSFFLGAAFSMIKSCMPGTVYAVVITTLVLFPKTKTLTGIDERVPHLNLLIGAVLLLEYERAEVGLNGAPAALIAVGRLVENVGDAEGAFALVRIAVVRIGHHVAAVHLGRRVVAMMQLVLVSNTTAYGLFFFIYKYLYLD